MATVGKFTISTLEDAKDVVEAINNWLEDQELGEGEAVVANYDDFNILWDRLDDAMRTAAQIRDEIEQLPTEEDTDDEDEEDDNSDEA